MLIDDGAVPRLDIALNLNCIPMLGVPDVVDDDVVVLAPKEGDSIEFFPTTENVSRRYLALTLRNHPMFNSDSVPGVRIGPPSDIARGKYPGRAGFEIFVDDDTAINCQARVFSQIQRRSHP